MKRTSMFSTLVCLLALSVFTATSFGMYNPATGTFISRDPGPVAVGTPRAGAGGVFAGSGFIPRDQYADGLNLYEYVRGSPLLRRDPTGLSFTVTSRPTTGSRPSYDCCCAENIALVLDGKFKGGWTMHDYWPDTSTNQLNTDLSMAGPYITPEVTGEGASLMRGIDRYAGAQVQFLTKVSGRAEKCAFQQWYWVQFYEKNGLSMNQDGKNHDDVAKSGVVQSKPPFRRDIDGNPSFADAPGVPIKPDTRLKWWFTSCIASGDGQTSKARNCCRATKCCVKWTLEINIDKTGVPAKPLVTKREEWCELWEP